MIRFPYAENSEMLLEELRGIFPYRVPNGRAVTQLSGPGASKAAYHIRMHYRFGVVLSFVHYLFLSRSFVCPAAQNAEQFLRFLRVGFHMQHIRQAKVIPISECESMG